MENIINYIKKHFIILLFGSFFLGLFAYLTYDGNQLCDCEKTEKYRDGTTRVHRTGGTHGFYRYHHK
ncbi:hypothetical protein OF897_14725 [Chryseobacterium formosus]|uniref:Uncharacterized protein n=1 Tax=Chryseobacterium formosus TaxID=1537363 RepID=A0ABT3XSS3_9FLAO|nr:hypothetical protein [Chryseobacterium formosus]MCX8525172.1 hypothetical protein [Chryseobacterium formosus]